MAGKKRAVSGKVRLLTGLLLAVLTCVLVLGLSAQLMQKGSLPQQAAPAAVQAACIAGSLVGAALGLYRQRQRWKSAALFAAGIAAIFLLAAVCCSAGEGELQLSLRGLLCALGPVLLTALITGRRKTRRRR